MNLPIALPAAIGYWVGLLSLFVYLRHRLTALWALAGVMMSMCMAAFEYSYESRSYGIFLRLVYACVPLLVWHQPDLTTASTHVEPLSSA